MKRTRFIALALVVALMLMGAGYAAWNDRIEVRGTVNTGKVDVQIVSGEILPRAMLTDDTRDSWVSSDADNNNMWIETKLDNNAKSAAFKFDKLYPGAEVKYIFRATNEGNLPVRVSDVKLKAYSTDADGSESPVKNFLHKNILTDCNLAIINTEEHTKVKDIAIGSDMSISELRESLEDKLLSETNPIILYPNQAIGGSTENGDDLKEALTFKLDNDTFKTKVTNLEGKAFDVDDFDTYLTGLVGEVEHKGEDQGIVVEITLDFEQATDIPKN